MYEYNRWWYAGVKRFVDYLGVVLVTEAILVITAGGYLGSILRDLGAILAHLGLS